MKEVSSRVLVLSEEKALIDSSILDEVACKKGSTPNGNSHWIVDTSFRYPQELTWHHSRVNALLNIAQQQYKYLVVCQEQ